jgi:hypothetical protein
MILLVVDLYQPDTIMDDGATLSETPDIHDDSEGLIGNGHSREPLPEVTRFLSSTFLRPGSINAKRCFSPLNLE